MIKEREDEQAKVLAALLLYSFRSDYQRVIKSDASLKI